MKPKDFPTLFDRVHATCYVDNVTAFLPAHQLRRDLLSARRFVLDDPMSEMLGDLASNAFQANTAKARHRAIEAMRTGARLPHRLTWIEYNLRKTHEGLRRYRAINPGPGGEDYLSKLEEMPRAEGWLLEQHPQIETAFRATIYIADDHIDKYGFDCWGFPWAYIWTTDDTPLPWKGYMNAVWMKDTATGNQREVALSPLIAGLTGYVTDKIGVQITREQEDEMRASTDRANKMYDLLAEWGGVMRRMWALLSTINDLPVEIKERKALAKGFFAKRNYHKFLDYKTINLTIPQAEYPKVARQVIAKARRRAHMVRGHWRKDWRHEGQKIWIHEHQRGDASLGFVVHNYEVHRKVETDSA